MWNCELTDNRKLLNESDIVAFHLPDKYDHLPKVKFSFQKWLLMVYESPLNYYNLGHVKVPFDLSSTYKSTSDLVSLYYSPIYWTVNSNVNHTKANYLDSKKYFLAALISNCVDKSKRLEYLNDLKSFIPVQVYGKCGKQCPETDYHACKEYIGRLYKFLFAFENSVCQDYVTEKFFDILKFDIVPVVLGGAKYEQYIPKTGFINALEFDSPHALANHLLYVASNSTIYNSFFEWKRYVQFNPTNLNRGFFCELCIQMNLNAFDKISNSKIDDFWSRRSDCRLPRKKWNGAYAYEKV